MPTTITELYINGVAMPPPALQGVTIAHNKVWSSDTGRTASGKMVGTLVAVKTKLTIKWPALTEEQAAVIISAVNSAVSPFVPVKYRDASGTETTKTMYFGDISLTQYSWSDGFRRLVDVSVDAVEQ